MLTTTNYSLNIVEGTDLVNPLTVDNPNYQTIDAQMYANAIRAIPTATELKSGSIHAITRSNPNARMFRFTATSDFVRGETFTVDGIQVTAYTTDSLPLVTNAFRIGVSVLACLVGTILTVYVSSGSTATASDAERLGGELPSYYGTAADVTAANTTAQSAYSIATANQTNIDALTLRVSAVEGRQNITISVTDGVGYITY